VLEQIQHVLTGFAGGISAASSAAASSFSVSCVANSSATSPFTPPATRGFISFQFLQLARQQGEVSFVDVPIRVHD
jgi:hypothetical protein